MKKLITTLTILLTLNSYGAIKLIEYTDCSQNIDFERPFCDAINTEYEGVYLGGQIMIDINGDNLFTKCQHQEVVCLFPNTRSEGWYLVDKTTKLRSSSVCDQSTPDCADLIMNRDL